MKLDKNLV